ncbi:MAG: thiamine-phosphate kinase [Verrucomicrobia bacterium]|nr:thiamine-phosphate kinase [Verrucomicrobiota bacterium]
MNENELLNLIRKELPLHDDSIIVGSGDDCAVVKMSKKNLVLKTDATIEGIHFTHQDDLIDIGWKALCRPLSDFAAMGAIPQHALITVAACAHWKKENWLQLARGFGKAARAFGVIVVGGEMARSPEKLFLSVTITGSPDSSTVLRSGAKPNDLICVTGKLGGSLKSGRHLTFQPRLKEGQWLAAQREVHAMMDLSDGLGSDLPRLAQASNCSFILEKEKIPHHEGCSIEEAISDGEDYELLFTVAPETWPALQKKWKQQFPKLSLSCIGKMISSTQIFHGDSSRGVAQRDADKADEEFGEGLYSTYRPSQNQSPTQSASGSRKSQQTHREVFGLTSSSSPLPKGFDHFE